MVNNVNRVAASSEATFHPRSRPRQKKQLAAVSSSFVFSLLLGCLDEVCHVHGHLVDASVVELLDVVQRALVVVRHEVDGHALATETATTADPGRKEKGGK